MEHQENNKPISVIKSFLRTKLSGEREKETKAETPHNHSERSNGDHNRLGKRVNVSKRRRTAQTEQNSTPSDNLPHELAFAFTIHFIEKLKPDEWEGFLKKIPDACIANPVLASEKHIAFLLDRTSGYVIHGRNKLAVRCCDVADATLIYLDYPPSGVALKLADWWTRFNRADHAKTIWQELAGKKHSHIRPEGLAHYLGWNYLTEKDQKAAVAISEEAWQLLKDGKEEFSNALQTVNAVLLTLAHYEVGNISQAKEYLRWISLNDKFVDLAGKLGQLLSLSDNGTDPERTSYAYLHVAECFFALRWWQQSILCYQRSLEANPQLATAWRNLGDAFFAQGMTLKAIAAYQSALEIAPNDAPSHRFLGHAYLRVGKLSDAIQSTKQAIRSDPGYAQAIEQLKVLQKIEREGGLSSNPMEWPT